ncbi:Transcription factor IIS, N-terminal, partial [Dillenia turbinata]
VYLVLGPTFWVQMCSPNPLPPPPTSLSFLSPLFSVSVVFRQNCDSDDGRKISVGDCALFKPLQDLPPFIGIIRKLTQGKEERLKISVNWLYRPADVKLGKGCTLEAAPNEVFYSFHKDEIPAASLLHPCKVAFLRKGVELPSGISSFVCRRVYDIENKCLWWLTDKDYINEWQEEVDQLLDKTRLEMHGAVQSGGRSPKTLNGPSTTQLKSGSDSVQNSISSFPTQVKGKKRDRIDQCSDPVKRERFSKTDDGDSDQSRPENMLKSEISKITEKGALVGLEGVERLVQLMQPDSAEKKIDLASRIMLVDVIAVTDRLDCLGRFVQLRGLLILDEWLQEVHRGKISDSCSPKDGDKAIEEFLLALLRALDKLPVNLPALQTCNVGKSVNHLRSHKNFEIQRKARSLVDTWKRRVEAEMNMNDARSASGRGVSWPASKPVSSEVSHVGNRRPGGSSEVNMKTSIVHPCSSKTPSVKPGSGEIAKLASSSPNSTKSSQSLATPLSTNSKETNSRMLIGGTSDLPLTTIKEEKSSSSSQSQSNSQSCSSDHVKAAVSSCKEDARSSTAGSMSTNKTMSGASRSRKSTNGHLGSPGPGVQKEVGFGKFSCHSKNVTSEKVSPPGTCERIREVPPVDQVNSPRLIVKLPSTGRSPARTASVGSFEDSDITFGRTSPVHSEKHDQHDRKSEGKIDASHASLVVNLEASQEKVGVEGSDPINRSLEEERDMIGEDGEKPLKSSKSKIMPKSGKSFEPSLSSMNALIESCAKFSEASASTSAGDDIGMNLLATVAAGEMSKSNLSTPSGSPQRSPPDPDDSCSGNDANARHTDEDFSKECQPIDGCASAIPRDRTDDNSQLRDGSQNPSIPVSSGFGESKTALSDNQDKIEQSLEQSSRHLQQNMGCLCRTSEENGGNPANVVSVTAMEVDGADEIHDKKTSDFSKVHGSTGSYTESKVRGGLFNEDKMVGNADENTVEHGTVTVSETDVKSAIVEKEALEDSPSCSSLDVGHKRSMYVIIGSSNGILAEQKPSPLGKVHSDTLEVKNDDSVALNSLCLESKAGKADDDVKVGSHTENLKKQELDCSSSVSEPKIEKAREDSGRKELVGPHSVVRADTEVLPALKESEQCIRPAGSKSDRLEADGREHGSLASLGGSNLAGKLDFDLNEGLPVEEGNQVDLIKSAAPSISSTIHLPCPMPFPTVAAAAKRPFVPPESLLRTKVELGWKGSAATSAFRPAEPRKVLEMPLSTPDILLVNNQSGKQSRPPLDIDLNVPDERALEDLTPHDSSQVTCSESVTSDRSTGGLDLDLNKVDDNLDVGQFSIGRSDATLQDRPSISGGFPIGEGNSSRGFDLNNGPGVDDAGPEPAPRTQHSKSNMPFLSPVSGMRMNSAELSNFSSWPPQGSSYSTIAIPSVLPARGEQSYPVVATSGSQRILGPPGGSTSFGLEIYRAPVLSSSPAVPFPPAAPFQFSGYPFETNFPLSSNSFSGCSTPYMDSSSGGPLCFPAIPSQLVGPAGVVPSHFPRPYVVSIPRSMNGTTESRKWGSQGLDLNAGPGVVDVERRDERLPPALRQFSVTSSQSQAEEQLKMYQMAGGVLKRKEPDGGWDADRFSYNQRSWQ